MKPCFCSLLSDALRFDSPGGGGGAFGGGGRNGWKSALIRIELSIELVSWGYSLTNMKKMPARMSTKCLGKAPLIPFFDKNVKIKILICQIMSNFQGSYNKAKFDHYKSRL